MSISVGAIFGKIHKIESTNLINPDVINKVYRVATKIIHTHEPHLTIFLTDALRTLTAADGKSQDFKITAGTTLWSERDTHIAVNSGEKVTKLYLVELKND